MTFELQSVLKQHNTLKGEYEKKNFAQCRQHLDQLALALTKMQFLPESMKEASANELTVARDSFEIGAFVSIELEDKPSFERYMSQLKCYYLDFKDNMSESPYKYELLGLHLLYLLSQNRVAEFHTELELFAYPDYDILKNMHIKKVVEIEQYVMEGRYNKIFLAKNVMPSASYGYFMGSLLDTIRDEISACVEKSYDKLKAEEARKILNFVNESQLNEYAAKRAWVHNKKDNCFYFTKVKAEDERIPSYELAANSIEYAKELEMIV